MNLKQFVAMGSVCAVFLFSACSGAASGGGTERSFVVDAAVSGPGTVEKSPEAAEYAPGQEVTLTATSNPGCQFDGWSDGFGNQTTLVVSVDENISITAYFCVDSEGDSDGDGVVNWKEDVNRNGDYADDDTDRDTVPDYRDDDDDGDGTPTGDELGIPDKPNDADRDNLPDYLESSQTNPYGPGAANQFNADDDGDDVPTKEEFDPWSATDKDRWLGDDDTDGDGIINAYDNDDDNDGYLTSRETDNGTLGCTPRDWTEGGDDSQPNFLEADVIPTWKE